MSALNNHNPATPAELLGVEGQLHRLAIADLAGTDPDFELRVFEASVASLTNPVAAAGGLRLTKPETQSMPAQAGLSVAGSIGGGPKGQWRIRLQMAAAIALTAGVGIAALLLRGPSGTGSPGLDGVSLAANDSASEVDSMLAVISAFDSQFASAAVDTLAADTESLDKTMTSDWLGDLQIETTDQSGS